VLQLYYTMTDRAKSATTDQRPEFLRMIKDSASNKFHVVLVHKLDRFSRNRQDSIGYRMELKRHNVSLISVLENIDEDSPKSIILESVLEAMAEYYSKNLAREVQKGKMENAYKGIHTGGTPPLGYDVDPNTRKLIINEYEAEAVRIIFKRTLECYGYSEIIDELNHIGYKTKRGLPFTKTSIFSILLNEKYTGVYIYNRSAPKDVDGKRNGHKYKDPEDIVRIEGAVPVIISVDDYKMVQKKLKNRKKTQKSSRAKEVYLLRTKMVCGVCGGAYIGTNRNRGDKTKCVAYICNKRYRNHSIDCQNKDLSRNYIESSVLGKLSEYVFNDKFIPFITEEYNRFLKERSKGYMSKMKMYKNNLNDVSKNIDSLVNLLMQTQSQALFEKLKGYEKEKVQIESKIEALQNENKITTVTEDDIKIVFEKIREQLSSGELKNLQQVIDMYISKIIVYPDHVMVNFNFFPSINLELDEDTIKENHPSCECGSDIHGQFSSDKSTCVDDGGG